MSAAYHRPPHAVQVQPWRVVADEAAAVTVTTHGFADSAPVKISALFRSECRGGTARESVQLFIDDAQTRALPEERCTINVANARDDTVLALTALLGHDDRGHWCTPSTAGDHAALADLFASGDNLRFELTAGDADTAGLPRTPFVAFVLAGSPGFAAVRTEVNERAVQAAARPPRKPVRRRRPLRTVIAAELRRIFARRARPAVAVEPVLPAAPGPHAEPVSATEPLIPPDTVVMPEPEAMPEPVIVAAPVLTEVAMSPAPAPEPARVVVEAVAAPPAVPATVPTPAAPRRSWLAWLRKPAADDGVMDRAAAIRRRALIAAYRGQGTRLGRAPGALTPDAAVIDVHERVTAAYARVAGERGETLTPARLHYIAWRFMETRETLGDDMLRSHLRHELRRYRAEGLRPDFQRDLKIDLPA